MEKLSYEYLAGLFDGEGCIRIQKNKWSISCINPVYSLRLTINMTDKTVINTIHSMFGGCLNVSKRPNPKHHTMYNWIIGSKMSYKFLQKIEPFCIVKKEQIKIALQFQEHIIECGHLHWGRNKCVSPEIVSFRETCYSKLKSLKTDF